MNDFTLLLIVAVVVAGAWLVFGLAFDVLRDVFRHVLAAWRQRS